MKGQSRFISSIYLPEDAKIMDPSKMQRNEANTLLECWLDQQDNQVGLTLKFKAWIDDRGKMHGPVSKESDDSNGDADDEGMWPMPTKNSSAGAPKGRPRVIKRAHISSTDEESDKTDADVPLPKVNKHAPYRVGKGANATRGDPVGSPSESDDQPVPKSFSKRVRTRPAIISPQTDSAYED